MTTWADSHCHIQLMDDPAAALRRSPDVSLLVVAGVDAASSAAALEMGDNSAPRIHATAGLHPDFAGRWPTEGERIAELAELAVAVGETGLDFYRDLAPRRQQLEAFREQLDLAARLDKPVVVHCRDAFREVYDMLDKQGAGERAVLHGWSAGPNWTARFLGLGAAFSFAGPLMLAADPMIMRGAALVSPDRVLTESDAPHFCWRRARGCTGDPADVAVVGSAFALLWGTSRELAAGTIAAATRSVYRL